jgi:hypothetical protein
MADYDSNMIKPVEGLHSITALTPTKRREERRQQKQFEQKKEEENEQQVNESADVQDMDNQTRNWNEDQDNLNSDSTGIDYCA